MRNRAVGITVTLLGFLLVFVVRIPTTGNLAVFLGTCKKLIGFSMMVIGAMCAETKVWYNPVSKYISGVSLEIYLAHMMVFRVIEKAGLTGIAGTSVLSYAIVCGLTVGGVVLFAAVYQRLEKIIKKRLCPTS